jgi:hypothetical protein
MALPVHPERFQSEVALNLVRNLLGWGAPSFAGRIHAGASPPGELASSEFVLFVSYFSCGLPLPISPFFLLSLEELGLQLQHEDGAEVALLPPAPGREGIAQQPSGDGQRVELRLHLSHELHRLLQRPCGTPP